MRPKALLAALGVFVLCAATMQARADDFDFSGTFTYDNDVVLLNFTVAAPSMVTVFSSSWLQGDPPAGFDPMLGIWTAGGSLISFQDDGGVVGQTDSNGVTYDHGTWDSWYQVDLLPGDYIASITQYGMFPASGVLSDGFSYDGVGGQNFTFVNGWGGATQPYFNGVWDDLDGRTGNWAFHLVNVASATQAPVPEPSSAAALVVGCLAALGMWRRRRSA